MCKAGELSRIHKWHRYRTVSIRTREELKFMTTRRDAENKLTEHKRNFAEELAAAADADLWEIVPLVPYTKEDLDYKNPKSRSSVEMKDPYERPTIKMCTDTRHYKVIFLGFPIWWGVCPKLINSWIENNDLTGKIMVPFATSGSSQIAPAVDYLRKTYPDYKWEDGRLLNSYPEGFLTKWAASYKRQNR